MAVKHVYVIIPDYGQLAVCFDNLDDARVRTRIKLTFSLMSLVFNFRFPSHAQIELVDGETICHAFWEEV